MAYGVRDKMLRSFSLRLGDSAAACGGGGRSKTRTLLKESQDSHRFEGSP
jgi:hypothetical protein